MGYTFTIPLLIVNFIVYVPGALAFVLASRRPVAGPLIAIAFLKLHLLGAWVPVWGPWNEPFTVLGVDTLSWAILWITAVVGIVVGLVGAYLLGRSGAERAGAGTASS